MFIGIALLLSYSIALISVGHGVIPIALVLVWGIGSPDSWIISGTVAGWIGIVSLVFATFLLFFNPLKQLTYQFLASTILYLSWLVIAIRGNGENGDFWSSFVLSAPFQITFFIIARSLILQHNQTVTDSDDVL